MRGFYSNSEWGKDVMSISPVKYHWRNLLFPPLHNLYFLDRNMYFRVYLQEQCIKKWRKHWHVTNFSILRAISNLTNVEEGCVLRSISHNLFPTGTGTAVPGTLFFTILSHRIITYINPIVSYGNGRFLINRELEEYPRKKARRTLCVFQNLKVENYELQTSNEIKK